MQERTATPVTAARGEKIAMAMAMNQRQTRPQSVVVHGDGGGAVVDDPIRAAPFRTSNCYTGRCRSLGGMNVDERDRDRDGSMLVVREH